MLLGQLISRFLKGESKYWESLEMTETEANNAIKEGLKLWNKVLSITDILQKTTDGRD
jgi:hypothetical protein